MSLPWDELQPEPEPVEELPYEPPDPVVDFPPAPGPGPKPPADWALEAALEDLWPTIKDKAVDYARASWDGISEGKTVDVLHPTVTAETAAGKELVVADAKSRSWRTLVQGLIVDVIAAVVIVLGMLTELDPFVKESWILIGALLVKSVLSAIISYFMRLKVQPTIKLPEVRMNVMPLPTRIEEEHDRAGSIAE